MDRGAQRALWRLTTSVTPGTSATHRYRYETHTPPRLTVSLVQPSSLIFLVIVAIWVAYLIQHWVRRREHLATARSVDRFSEAMRVLERRSPLSSTMLATASGVPGSSGPSASARRPASATTSSGERSEVFVKRASVSSPLRARTAARGEAGPVHEVAPIELVPHRTTAQVVLRRVRGVLFLAALVAVPLTLVLSLAHILKWLSVGLAITALVISVVWLRVAAVRDSTARRARRAELRRMERVRAAGTGRSAVGSGELSATRSDTWSAAEVAGPVTSPAPASTHTPEPVTEVNLDPDAWQPVPVPPPTYTLKEPAHRPEPVAEGSHSDGAGMRPVPIEVDDDELEIMAVAHGRRVVGR